MEIVVYVLYKIFKIKNTFFAHFLLTKKIKSDIINIKSLIIKLERIFLWQKL